MIHHTNSRRNFLSSLVIISAGTAFGSAADFLPLVNPQKDLQQLWTSLYNQYNGEPYLSFHETKDLPTCEGHISKKDAMVYFPNENLLAQPAWIYWGENKKRPADLVITFYHNDQEHTKAFRLNRFELEALAETKSGLSAGLSVKTIIRKGKDTMIYTVNAGNKRLMNSKLVYNI